MTESILFCRLFGRAAGLLLVHASGVLVGGLLENRTISGWGIPIVALLVVSVLWVYSYVKVYGGLKNNPSE